jgi:signal transduction histidine kinase
MAQILVIDGNADSLRRVTYLIEAFGHTPLSASGETDGLAAALAERPDLILYNMPPESSDYTIARQIKADTALQAVPLVAMSAPNALGHHHVLEAGFDGCITVPLAPQTFVEQVEPFLAPAPHGSPTAPEAPTAAPGATSALPDARATILVVDDKAVNLDLLATLLGSAGYQVLLATSAVEALAHVRESQPDLVVTDVLMPEVDGFEFTRRLRADPAIAHTNVIFYTAAYVEAEARALAEACGVKYLLTKPAEPQVILDTIHAAMSEPTTDVALPAEAFEQAHQRLLLDTLTQKVDELERLNAGLATLNAELEQRVAARTAELADANTRLHELNTFKDNILAMASHDLRSPLGAIQNTAELLLEDFELPEEGRHLVKNIDASTRHLISMVGDMLDLSRLESGKVELELTRLYISDVALRSIEALRASAQAKELAVQLIADPGEQPLHVDWMKLSQTLNNLLSNAIKFTAPGGQIAIRVGPEPGGTRVSVADTGLGIPAEALPHLFEKFRQAHTRGTAGERGSGLGLAIVQQLVELHGGSIEVASEIGRGSEFTIHLPATNDH